LQFQKLVQVQVVENTVFYASVVTLALMGYGLTSFTISVILRSLTGLVLLYSIAFWRPHFGFNKKSFHELIHFGLPFQGASMMALLKDDLLMLYLAKAIGFEALGLVGWAKKMGRRTTSYCDGQHQSCKLSAYCTLSR
jgi:O-antigen/teichoic acid export membrane protein